MQFTVSIENRKPLMLIALRHEGSFYGLPKKLQRVFDWLEDTRQMPKNARPIGVYYNTPYAEKDFDLRSAAGVAIPDDGSLYPEPPFERIELASGPHAVVQVRGSLDLLGEAFAYLHAQWLPQSGRQLSGEPRYAEFLTDWRTTRPEDNQFELCVPLANVSSPDGPSLSALRSG